MSILLSTEDAPTRAAGSRLVRRVCEHVARNKPALSEKYFGNMQRLHVVSGPGLMDMGNKGVHDTHEWQSHWGGKLSTHVLELLPDSRARS